MRMAVVTETEPISTYNPGLYVRLGPPRRNQVFQELTYISEFFDTVEINVTFYHPIPARTSESWLKKVDKKKRFKFTGKLWQGFTHDRNAGAEDERMFKE